MSEPICKPMHSQSDVGPGETDTGRVCCQLTVKSGDRYLPTRDFLILVSASLAMVGCLKKDQIAVRHYIRKSLLLTMDIEFIGSSVEGAVRAIGEHIANGDSPLHTLPELKQIYSGAVFHVLANATHDDAGRPPLRHWSMSQSDPGFRRHTHETIVPMPRVTEARRLLNPLPLIGLSCVSVPAVSIEGVRLKEPAPTVSIKRAPSAPANLSVVHTSLGIAKQRSDCSTLSIQTAKTIQVLGSQSRSRPSLCVTDAVTIRNTPSQVRGGHLAITRSPILELPGNSPSPIVPEVEDLLIPRSFHVNVYHEALLTTPIATDASSQHTSQETNPTEQQPVYTVSAVLLDESGIDISEIPAPPVPPVKRYVDAWTWPAEPRATVSEGTQTVTMVKPIFRLQTAVAAAIEAPVLSNHSVACQQSPTGIAGASVSVETESTRNPPPPVAAKRSVDAGTFAAGPRATISEGTQTVTMAKPVFRLQSAVEAAIEAPILLNHSVECHQSPATSAGASISVETEPIRMVERADNIREAVSRLTIITGSPTIRWTEPMAEVHEVEDGGRPGGPRSPPAVAMKIALTPTQATPSPEAVGISHLRPQLAGLIDPVSPECAWSDEPIFTVRKKAINLWDDEDT